jgi:hypothetical protein
MKKHNAEAFAGTRLLVVGTVLLAVMAIGTSRVGAQGAPDPSATAKSTPIPNSENNYQGDRVSFPYNMTVTVDPGYGQPKGNQCLKAGAKLRGLGPAVTSGGTIPLVDFVPITCSPAFGLGENGLLGTGILKSKDDCNLLCPATDAGGAAPSFQPIPYGSKIEIPLTDVQNSSPSRYGLAYGGLAVPFKFQLTGNHQLTSSATIGPYLGWKFDTGYGWAMTAAAFAGVSNNAVPKTTNTPTSKGKTTVSSSNTQTAGFSYGGGLLVEVKGGFQGGLVLGFDTVGGGQNFQYDNKPWIALQLGYSFSQ